MCSKLHNVIPALQNNNCYIMQFTVKMHTVSLWEEKISFENVARLHKISYKGSFFIVHVKKIYFRTIMLNIMNKHISCERKSYVSSGITIK